MRTPKSRSDAKTPQELVREAWREAGGKPRRRTNPETLILRAVKAALEAVGWIVIRIHQGLGSTPGIADLVVMGAGRTIWIEIKTPTGNQSPVQKLFQFEVEVSGGEYRIVRSVDDVSDLVERGVSSGGSVQ